MTIQEIYNLAIKKGIAADFRGEEAIQEYLNDKKKDYEKMSDYDKEVFDKERLTNPFSDSRILFGDPNKEVKKILVGIDMEGAELLMAKEMKDIDLVIAHHPRGIALAGLDDVMNLQIDVLEQYGVPVNIAEKITKKRISEVSRGVNPSNHNRPVDMAKILDIPYMCLHTPCDNLVANFLKEKIEKENPKYVEDVLNILKDIPEYKEAAKNGTGPCTFVGGPRDRAGKVVLTELTGGTEGSPEIYERLAQTGAGTIVGMHISEKHKEEAEKANVNVVIAGHISSDSLGVNLFLDELEKKGVEIVPCSGLTRYSRN
jgi:putative NIF3 family GTP cyclohydrolase 1 type 2